ncbi:MAG: MGMT family protein [Sulfolobales archaeon]
MKRRKDLIDLLVYTLVQMIPVGRVATYSSIARVLRVHPRRVAIALKKNKNPIVIPCHRVVMSDLRIGGYSLGVEMKKRLLELEGVEIVGDRIRSREYVVKLDEELL